MGCGTRPLILRQNEVDTVMRDAASPPVNPGWNKGARSRFFGAIAAGTAMLLAGAVMPSRADAAKLGPYRWDVVCTKQWVTHRNPPVCHKTARGVSKCTPGSTWMSLETICHKVRKYHPSQYRPLVPTGPHPPSWRGQRFQYGPYLRGDGRAQRYRGR